MNARVFRLGSLCVLLGAAMAVQAQNTPPGVSWTYIHGSYQWSEFDFGDAGDVDGDGPRIEGSLQVHPWVHLLASYETSDLDNISIPVDETTSINLDPGDAEYWSIGIGLHTPVLGSATRDWGAPRDQYSFFLDARYLNRDFDLTSGDDSGYSVDLGLRAINFTNLELIGAVGVEDFEGSSGEFTLEGRVLWRVWRDLQLEAGADWNDEVTRLFLGARYNFPGFSVL